MPIGKLNRHYSFENPASVYDEEALTALELAARTTAKVNECVDVVNGIPDEVAEQVDSHIEGGAFDAQIDQYVGGLKQQVAKTEAALTKELREAEDDLGNRLDTLLGSVTTGSTSGDAELIDIRAGDDGNSYASAGTAVRAQLAHKISAADGIKAASHTENLLTEDGIVYGFYYDSSTGEHVAYANGCHYPPVSVGGGVELSLYNAQIVTCLDASGAVLYTGSKASNAWVSYTTPANCATLIVSKSATNTIPSGVYLGSRTGDNETGNNLLAPEQVEGLPELMRTAARKTEGKNLFNKNSSNLVLGYYYNYQTGQRGTQANYEYLFIDAEPATDYVISPDGNNHITFFDAGGNFISGVGGWGNLQFTTPENCAKICLSVGKSKHDVFQIEKGTVATAYEEYGMGIGSNDIKPGAIGPDHLSTEARLIAGGGKLTVTVGAEGCDYTSLLAAMRDNGENTRFLVQSGTYDMQAEYIAEYGSSYFTDYTTYRGNSDPFSRGYHLYPGCEIIGVGPVTITFPYTGDNEGVNKYFSILNPTYNNVMENLTLSMATGAGRYHIHDDFAVAGKPGNTVMRDIKMYGIPHLGTCIGSGMGTCNNYLIENCFCDPAVDIGIAYHNNVHEGKNNLTIRNCYMGSTAKIKLNNYGPSTELSEVLITGCKAEAIELGWSEQATYPNVNIRITEWGNELG